MSRSMKYFSSGAASVCLALALGAAAPARADDETATRSVAVSLNDLDLTSTAGRALAQRRIDVAAHDVCEAADIRQLHVGADYLRCRAAALDGASAQLQVFETAAARRAPSISVTDTITH